MGGICHVIVHVLDDLKSRVYDGCFGEGFHRVIPSPMIRSEKWSRNTPGSALVGNFCYPHDREAVAW